MMGWRMMDGGMGGWMMVNFIFWILLLAGIAALAVWVARRLGPGGTGGDGRDSALQILRERYARGEITKEQFEEMKRNLS